MQIGLLGLNYRFSSASHRESFTAHLLSIVEPYQELSYVLVSTCNRIELYFSAEDIYLQKRKLLNSLAKVMPAQLMNELYAFVQFDCFYHLTKVTAGIDSALFGESEIQHQVKVSYESARKERILSKEMHYLFQKALMIGKMIRKMGIERLHRNALEQTIIHFILREYQGKKARCLLVGNSHVNRKLWPFLEEQGFDVTLCSRTLAQIEKFLPRERLTSLSEYDVVICGTNDLLPIVDSKLAKTIHSSCLIFDLGMPRNVDPLITQNSKACLFDLEQLQNFMKTEFQVPQMVQESFMSSAYSMAKRYHERFAAREQTSSLSLIDAS